MIPYPGHGSLRPHDAIARLVGRHVDPTRQIGPEVTDPEPVDDTAVLAAAG